ncbi:hypothetical protein HDU83_004142 [Entophlyctis luteolus]|nr:hypothetical protein HDU83_004142 [Entophlyctis luteolus]KAJ3382573.1 hypothetical protein HDU84_004216 [Entophlyctis sp. JEL0112]
MRDEEATSTSLSASSRRPAPTATSTPSPVPVTSDADLAASVGVPIPGRALQVLDSAPPQLNPQSPSQSPSPSLRRDNMRMSPSLSLSQGSLLFGLRSSTANNSPSLPPSASASLASSPASSASLLRRKLSWNVSSTLSSLRDGDGERALKRPLSSSVLGSFLSTFGFRTSHYQQAPPPSQPLQPLQPPVVSQQHQVPTVPLAPSPAPADAPVATVVPPLMPVSDSETAQNTPPQADEVVLQDPNPVSTMDSDADPEMDSDQEDIFEEPYTAVDGNLTHPTPANNPSPTDTVQQEEFSNRLSHKIIWAVASELGYRNMLSTSAHPVSSNLVTTEFVRIPIHTEIEDIHWPSKEDKDLWTASGLGGDHVLHGHSFSNGGVVTSELDGAFEKVLNDDKFDVVTDTGSVLSGSCDESDSEIDQQDNNDEDLMETVASDIPEAVGSSQSSAASIASSDTESTLSSTQSIKENDMNMPSSSRDIHSPYESKFEPSSAIAVSSKTKALPTTEKTRLFILADGHGGILASKFFVPRTKSVLTELLQSRSWNFDIRDDRAEFESKAIESFRIIDAEYCAIQVARYRTWVDGGSIASERPDDDGCALAVAVIHNGWLVNLNVGDSRMTLVSRPKNSGSAHWNTVFVSTDHNMTHPAKVYSIYKSGGHFMSPSHSLIPIVPVDPAERRQPYTELANARIYRHASAAVKAVGVSHRRTLNLTGTMGDLLFKIEPAVLNGVPDVSFVELDARAWEYVMVLATDGIWDHLMDNSGDAERHTAMVSSVVGAAIESVEIEARESAELWAQYWREHKAWTAREKARRIQRREERRRRKESEVANVAMMQDGGSPTSREAPYTEDSDKVAVGIHGALGDVAAAAEPSEKTLGEEAQKQEQADECGSIASSNGSTAVASKSRRMKSKTAGAVSTITADDAMIVDEEDESVGPSEVFGSRNGVDEDSELTTDSKTPFVQENDADIDVEIAEAVNEAFKATESEHPMNVEDGITKGAVSEGVKNSKRRGERPPKKPPVFDFHGILEQRLQQAAFVLAERELRGKNAESVEQRIHPAILQAAQSLYWPKQIRYDDATAFVAYFG